MKQIVVICLTLLVLLFTTAVKLYAQRIRVPHRVVSSYSGAISKTRIEIIDGDTVQAVDILQPAYVFKNPIDRDKHARLIRNVKVVYPIAKEAKQLLLDIERVTIRMKTTKEQREYISKMEEVLKQRYTPVLKTMTFSQGKVLLKLIDRETDRTSYSLVQELRGNFSAFLWQGVANIFGANLKSEFNKSNNEEDRLIEKIIILHEIGVL